MEHKPIENRELNFPCLKAIRSGKCHGDCCGPVRIKADFYAQHLDDRAVEPLNYARVDQTHIMAAGADGHCVFMNRETYSCGIYDERPSVCRNYGLSEVMPCPYFDVNGRERIRAERRRVKRHINDEVDAKMSALREFIRRSKLGIRPKSKRKTRKRGK